MRVSDRWAAERSLRNMENSREIMAGLQEKLTSTKQFQRVSDDPGAASAALTLRSSLRAGQAFLDTASAMNDWMSATDLALSQLETNAVKAVNLVRQGATDTLSTQEREALGQELDTLLQEAIAIGNSNHQGEFLFAGYQVKMDPANAPNNVPFTLVEADPTAAVPTYVDSIAYHGDDGVMSRTVGPNGHTIAMNVKPRTPLSDLFNKMIAARDDLLDDASSAADINAHIETLSAALDKISDLRTQNGARQLQVQKRMDLLNATRLSLSGMLADKEDVNMAEAITQLRYQETVYQAVLEVNGRSLATANLFEYLG